MCSEAFIYRLLHYVIYCVFLSNDLPLSRFIFLFVDVIKFSCSFCFLQLHVMQRWTSCIEGTTSLIPQFPVIFQILTARYKVYLIPLSLAPLSVKGLYFAVRLLWTLEFIPYMARSLCKKGCPKVTTQFIYLWIGKNFILNLWC